LDDTLAALQDALALSEAEQEAEQEAEAGEEESV
jgi:hypothetical protein